MYMGTSILLSPNLSPCEEMVMCLSFNARFWGFMPLFWGFMPPFRFTSPDLPHSNPFGIVPWLPSDRFLLSSSRCTGFYGSGGDGDSRADLYSDPLCPPRSDSIYWLLQRSSKARNRVQSGICVELRHCYGSGACTTSFQSHGPVSLALGLL
ncbi:hypothetical protein PRUPE_1G171100 [Prunus persica]|uniref:Uncharacterized protein n=1 Tax=Prunus persica TaxID=3760 RepID=A0A251QZT6_PRUPE|nr:hypothetical protein PRUPE_1G171100 [Prunus persica]ONI28950.1 hypothetical protein PRUPE_1G171100 [Prunus persica]